MIGAITGAIQFQKVAISIKAVDTQSADFTRRLGKGLAQAAPSTQAFGFR